MSDHSDTQPNYGTSPKNLKSYVIGFILCVILTLVPFQAVAMQTLSLTVAYSILFGCAFLQLIVQVVCFLRLNASKDGLENLMSFLFALLVVFILIGGSMWIMWHLNYNMTH